MANNNQIKGLTDRDRGILEMIAEFGGKTFIEVLAATYWHGLKVPEQQARDRIQILKKKKLLRLVSTGLVKPRNAVAFTAFGRRWAKAETEIDAGSLFLSPVTIWHGIYEQVAWYWLRRAGRPVDRKVVWEWSKEHRHTPDLLYYHNHDPQKPVYVEIETNRKTPDRYLDIFEKSKADGVYAMLYIFPDRKKMEQIGRKLPTWDKIYMITIPDLIENVAKNEKVGAIQQTDFTSTKKG